MRPDDKRLTEHRGPYAPRGNEIQPIETSPDEGPPARPRRNCFVATVAYNDVNAPQIDVLREFRDNVFMKYEAGKAFVATYYSGVGKAAANFISRHARSLIPSIRMSLDFVVKHYQARKR